MLIQKILVNLQYYNQSIKPITKDVVKVNIHMQRGGSLDHTPVGKHVLKGSPRTGK